ncbi:MAG: hypothetical protein ABSH35_35265 [Isosphaeraceae bacterium]
MCPRFQDGGDRPEVGRQQVDTGGEAPQRRRRQADGQVAGRERRRRERAVGDQRDELALLLELTNDRDGVVGRRQLHPGPPRDRLRSEPAASRHHHQADAAALAGLDELGGPRAQPGPQRQQP